MARWGILILLVILSYPLALTANVHGASDAETVAGMTFAISANDEVQRGESVAVTLSVAGTWEMVHGYLYCNETQIEEISLAPDGYEWSETYYVLDLDLGCHNFSFVAYYWPEGWPSGWYGPAKVSVLVYIVELNPTFTLTWLSPLSKRDSFEAGRTIPIRFSVSDHTGFKCDESVTVTVTGPDEYSFSATYGTHRNDVRIRESAEYYIVYWKTPRTPGDYEISVEFDDFHIEPYSLSIELR